MKTRLLILSIFLSGCGQLLTAQDAVTRDMIYRTTVRILSDPTFNCYGALYEVNDSSISISSRYLKDYNSGKVETLTFPVDDLKVIYTNKPGNGKRGVWKGAVYGFAVGALFGAINANNTMLGAAGSMAFFGSAGCLVGVPIGFFVGKISGQKRTYINGSMDVFNQHRDRLEERAIMPL